MTMLDVGLQIGTNQLLASTSFFDRPGVQIEQIMVGPGVPLGFEQVYSPELGLGGVYGAWGEAYDNDSLAGLIESLLGQPLAGEAVLRLNELGFVSRHHIPLLSSEEGIELEVQVGARLLRAAAAANGWDPSEVDAVLIGMSVPASCDFLERIAGAAGIPESALKVSIHKGCDGSVAGLNLALNAGLDVNQSLSSNLAERLYGKKVLVGGIEGLSRVCRATRDTQALQLFGSGAGIIGIVPGQTMKFLVGDVDEVYDEAGLLQLRMAYPYTRRQSVDGQTLVEVTQTGDSSIRVAGMMHEPEDKDTPVHLGRGGLVRFFVRNGAPVVLKVYRGYHELMERLGTPAKEIRVAIVHHANLKINQLKAKTLWNEGICIPMPWLLSEFGNVSAASNMIAFLRSLPDLQPGDHVMFDGFGAGTYYDALAVEVGV